MDTIPSLLPYLTNLDQMNLVELDSLVLAAINHHPITTILFYPTKTYLSLPSQSGPSDLAKIILKHISIDSRKHASIDQYLARGMEVTRIFLYGIPPIKSLRTQRYNGLCELHIGLYRDSIIDLSWLPDFARAQPRLKKIIFDFKDHFLLCPAAPFIAPLIDELNRERLTNTIGLPRYTITRHSGGPGLASSTEPFNEWHVSGIFLVFYQWSSGRVLHIVHSLFPLISVLTIRSVHMAVTVCLLNILARFDLCY